MYDNDEIDFKYEERFQECIGILQEKEKNCDIKIADYIINNRFKKRLFLTHYHPCANILIEAARQVFNILGYEFDFDVSSIDENFIDVYTFPVSRYDIKFLKLDREPETEANEFYREHIINIYNEKKHIRITN